MTSQRLFKKRIEMIKKRSVLRNDHVLFFFKCVVMQFVDSPQKRSKRVNYLDGYD